MRKNKLLVGVQITVLLILVVLVLFRVFRRPVPPGQLVAFTDIRLHQLRHQAIHVDATTDIVAYATGSVDHIGPTGRLAAYAWILKHLELHPTWEMSSANLEAGEGLLVHVKADTFTLTPGRYDVFFATYGPEIRSIPAWRSDWSNWLLVLSTVTEDAPVRTTAAVPPEQPRAMWKSGPLGRDERAEQLFEVREATSVEVLAVGQSGRSSAHPSQDFAWIEQATTGTRVWQLTEDNSEHAGGYEANRLFAGSVTITPGIYRAVVRTGSRHAYDDWAANPPYNPESWGVRYG